jgi:alpha-glucosidase
MRPSLVLVSLFVSVSAAWSQERVASPDNHIEVTITGGKEIMISARFKESVILKPSPIGLVIQDQPEVNSVRRLTLQLKDELITSPVPEKRKSIRDHYRQLELAIGKTLRLHVRVYNDGFAYRFVSSFRDSVTIVREVARYSVPEGTTFYGSAVFKRNEVDIFHTSFEEPYIVKPADSIATDKLFFSPVLIGYANGVKASLTESDLEDYPGMFLQWNDQRQLEGVNAGYPLEVKVNPGEFPAEVVTRRADFIARTKGTRTFPWRVFMIAEEDKQLPSNDMVYRLGALSRVADTSWIKPGQGTDEWIIGINLFNVPFKAGINTATYKYYIDFAKQFGFERIMMDAGWSDNTDLLKINPDINMDEIAAYARQQGISLSMWTLAWSLDQQLAPALEQFKRWGVDFIMTDFMDRDDQEMVNFYHRIAAACADAKIMVMFHGAFKGAGFSRTWPHAITREGVLGSEYNIWSDKAHPDHNLHLPFIRMTAGPMDYEPGILDNATQKTFRPIGDKVMAMGSRMHQAAMFVVYESPIAIFSGNPSQGMQEPKFMELLGSIPTVWDETIVLDGKVGEYIITARKKGGDWYIGGMSGWKGHEASLDLSFLGDSRYAATIAVDGINADRYPSDYSISEREIAKSDLLKIDMAKGGGFVVVLKKR